MVKFSDSKKYLYNPDMMVALMAANRTTGITLCSIAAIPLGLWSLLIGGLFTLLGGVTGIEATLLGLVSMGVGVALIAASYGIFAMEDWGLKLGLVGFGIDALRRVVTLATDGATFFVVSAIFTLIAIGCFVVLLQNKDSFEGTAGASTGSPV